MPRIRPSLIKKALNISPLLPKLLPACRDLVSARNELRWIREHAATTGSASSLEVRVAAMCERRRRGVPLQYILGTQPFGRLDIKCSRGVLIPRPETEAYTVHVANLIRDGRILGGMHESARQLNVVDFCTGTGCIPLLLYSMLAKHFPRIRVAGVDISPTALNLALENLSRAVKAGNIPPPTGNRTMSFLHGDIFDSERISKCLGGVKWDIMVSNPPYVSSDAWKFGRGELSFSTRRYEPKLALVPRENVPCPVGWRHEDAFYARLLDVAKTLEPKVLLLEVGDEAQARRILPLLVQHPFARGAACEIWRDNPDIKAVDDEIGAVETELMHIRDAMDRGLTFHVKGSGNIRSIFVWKDNPKQVE